MNGIAISPWCRAGPYSRSYRLVSGVSAAPILEAAMAAVLSLLASIANPRFVQFRSRTDGYPWRASRSAGGVVDHQIGDRTRQQGSPDGGRLGRAEGDADPLRNHLQCLDRQTTGTAVDRQSFAAAVGAQKDGSDVPDDALACQAIAIPRAAGSRRDTDGRGSVRRGHSPRRPRRWPAAAVAVRAAPSVPTTPRSGLPVDRRTPERGNGAPARRAQRRTDRGCQTRTPRPTRRCCPFRSSARSAVRAPPRARGCAPRRRR